MGDDADRKGAMASRWPGLRAAALLAACGVVGAACSEPLTIAEPTTVAPTTTEQTAAVEESSAGTDAGSGAEGLVAAWAELWAGAELLVTDPPVAEEMILGVADESIHSQLISLFNPEAAGDFDNTPRTFENSPVVTRQDDGTYLVDDCAFEQPKVGNKTTWYRGTAAEVDGRWIFEKLEIVNFIGCVPSDLAEAVFGGYDAYWDARLDFWDPADPDHPLVEQTMTGMHLELIHGLLVDDQANGLVTRGRQVSHYEIIEVRTETAVVVRDCADQDVDRGVYDAASGERLEGIDPVVEGQRDFISAVMLFEDGHWKVSDIQAQRNTLCEYPPSAQGLPIVGVE